MRFQPLLPADPDAGDGIFGLDVKPEDALVHLLPVPFEATVSYKSGAADGPAAILAASDQVDLLDQDFGRVHRAGIYLHGEPRAVRQLGREAFEAAQVATSDEDIAPEDRKDALTQVNRAGERLNAALEARTNRLLLEGRIVGVVGGDHATPFGSIRAAARARPGMGILHIDAHADLRAAYQGFHWSHASIMYNVIRKLPEVARLVQVGIRDFCDEEVALIHREGARIHTTFDRDLRAARMGGVDPRTTFRAIVDRLPEEVWVSFDIDGLDPALCPHTGTPVPGGLSFDDATALLLELVASGRKILGFDLVEVAPGPGDPAESWDATVGARILYKLIGATVQSRLISHSAS